MTLRVLLCEISTWFWLRGTAEWRKYISLGRLSIFLKWPSATTNFTNYIVLAWVSFAQKEMGRQGGIRGMYCRLLFFRIDVRKVFRLYSFTGIKLTLELRWMLRLSFILSTHAMWPSPTTKYGTVKTITVSKIIVMNGEMLKNHFMYTIIWRITFSSWN